MYIYASQAWISRCTFSPSHMCIHSSPSTTRKSCAHPGALRREHGCRLVGSAVFNSLHGHDDEPPRLQSQLRPLRHQRLLSQSSSSHASPPSSRTALCSGTSWSTSSPCSASFRSRLVVTGYATPEITGGSLEVRWPGVRGQAHRLRLHLQGPAGFAADGNAENFARRRWTEIRHLLGVRLRALRRLGAPLRVLWLTLSDAASCALIATSRLVFVFPPRRLLTRRLGARWAAQRPCWRPLTSSALLVSPRTAMPRTSRTVAIPRSTESLATPRLPLAVRQPGVRGCAQRPRRQLQAPAASRAQIFGHMASARPRRTIPRALRLPQVT
jgi:hypothetical protein